MSAEFTLQRWERDVLNRWAQARARGEHDDECEMRERSYICHCAKRQRLKSGPTEMPRLVVRGPECSECLSELEWDDGFHCRKCHVIWPSSAGDGDLADSFYDDHGDPSTWGGERFGRLLRELYP